MGLAGPSGSGKSTLALALVRAGFGFLGDDILFLRSEGETLKVLSFPDEIDVSDETASWFPELRHVVGQAHRGWPKHRIRAEEVYQMPFLEECRPAAVVFPRISSASPTRP